MVLSFEKSVDRLLHVGVQMDWIYDFHVPAFFQFKQCLANIFHGVAEIFAAVRCHQDQFFPVSCRSKSIFLARIQTKSRNQFGDFLRLRLPAHELQRVNDRVAGYLDNAFINPFAQKILFRPFCRREMQVGGNAGYAAIDLFGEGLPFVMSP